MCKALPPLASLAQKTELLEALDWDEQKLSKLEEYLYLLSKDFVVRHPVKVISDIKLHFGDSAALLIEKHFVKFLGEMINKGE